tara:strand:+ start:232 stop:531 length:300 start_codon:yes stop_codon:yes gene_type:complete
VEEYDVIDATLTQKSGSGGSSDDMKKLESRPNLALRKSQEQATLSLSRDSLKVILQSDIESFSIDNFSVLQEINSHTARIDIQWAAESPIQVSTRTNNG